SPALTHLARISLFIYRYLYLLDLLSFPTRRSSDLVLIRIDSVTKRYPDGTVAVDRLSLDVPDRSITVLVGPSGCGKTTTLRMINRMVDPTEGTILLDGEDKIGRAHV